MSVTDGIGQTPCSLEHYFVVKVIVENVVTCFLRDSVLPLKFKVGFPYFWKIALKPTVIGGSLCCFWKTST